MRQRDIGRTGNPGRRCGRARDPQADLAALADAPAQARASLRGRRGRNRAHVPTRRFPAGAPSSLCKVGTPAPHRPKSFLRLGSWIGGDRDGNPNVTAESLQIALRKASPAALQSYLDQIHALGSELSISTEVSNTTDELSELADSSGGSTASPRGRTLPWCVGRLLCATCRDLRELFTRPSAGAAAERAGKALPAPRGAAHRPGDHPALAGPNRCGLARSRWRTRAPHPRGRELRIPSGHAVTCARTPTCMRASSWIF